ncbi:ATP-binding protein [Bifidobacterium sp. ESL0745]|uniref:ATP-binding protein n=1 Tax=Bifidobacterium sp. ESL0745 TaxID=2983226 RepID=UPI0023F8A859|nr:ATP-binding protein [Bifidobacterium sp. ESL0745]MDF7666098.1 ATP-binding protein [Bifidobacterium sp. ESL0745]
MTPRLLAPRLNKMATWFPVVSVTGPRQSGKSTLVRAAFTDYRYVNLEDPQMRHEAETDPVGFIRNRPNHLVVDEAQYVPDLFSMIQVASDERNEPGQYVLSGSQNFLMLKNIKQSLAGRVGITKLLPFSYTEALKTKTVPNVDEFMLRGGYPRPYDNGMPLDLFFSSYIDTYVERDVADYLGVRNVVAFRKFLDLCALNVGSLINYTHLANELNVRLETVKGWLSILESSYMVFRLMPFHYNAGKRLTKTPKLYFYDTGLLCYLLKINSVQELLLSPALGSVFENLMVSETAKRYFNRGKDPELYFYHDDSDIEVDLLDFTDSSQPDLVEIKSSQTYHDRFAKHVRKIAGDLGVSQEHQWVVSRVESSYTSNGVNVCTAKDWLLR